MSDSDSKAFFDHQKVRLIAVTKPLDLSQSAEDLISYCARVSNPSNQENFQTSSKLLKYCLEHQHFSVFEMVHVVLELETTRDIGRQILRHKSFSFQEFSQRYADSSQLGFVQREPRLQDTKNRQNSIEMEDDQQERYRSWIAKQQQIVHESELAYKWALNNGIAKEQARSVLPEGLTMSRMYMAGSLRSFLHYCTLRMGPETQKEHRDIAEKCWNILEGQFEFLKHL